MSDHEPEEAPEPSRLEHAASVEPAATVESTPPADPEVVEPGPPVDAPAPAPAADLPHEVAPTEAAAVPTAPVWPSSGPEYGVPPGLVAPVAATTNVPPAASDPAPGAAWRRGITVPLWIFLLIGAVVVLGGAFLLGRATADDHTDAASAPVVKLPNSPTTPPITTPATGRPLLGVVVRDADNQGGAYVLRITGGRAADNAGIQIGDVIVSFDGKNITGANDLVNAVSSQRSGDDVAVAYQRNGDRHTVTVRLGS